MDLRTTRVLEGCMVIRAVALHLERTARRANATLDAHARARWLHGCSICAGLNWRVGDGPCRCRAPTRTRPTPTRKALPAARGVRLGCAWAYSAATVTRHGSRAAILISGGSIWGRPFLDKIPRCALGTHNSSPVPRPGPQLRALPTSHSLHLTRPLVTTLCDLSNQAGRRFL